MTPRNFQVQGKLVDLETKDATQINSWEMMLLEASELLSLTKPQYKTISSRYENLQAILNGASEPLLRDAHIFVQGSIGLRTTIKPVKGAEGEMGTVDADAIILLPHAGTASAEEVLTAIENRFNDGSRVEAPIKPLRRGIRLVYADENPGFHIDITPARATRGNTDEEGLGHLEVPDRKTGWKASSPRSYSKWLDDISKQQISVALDYAEFSKSLVRLAEAEATATQEPMPEYDNYVASNPLRVTIKLIKRHRDEWAIKHKRESVRPISAILTTLATLAYEEVVAESRLQNIRPLDAIFKIVEKMHKFIRFENDKYYVRNPKDRDENFAEKWNRPNGEGKSYQDAFAEWYNSAYAAFSLGFRQLGSASQFETALNESFGIPISRVKDMVNSLPRNWTLPGQTPGVTLNSLSVAGLLGSGFASHKSQADVKPVGRLG